MTIDKIKLYVNPQIINTINECVNRQEKILLEKWLTDCKTEIERRKTEKQDIFPLQYEQTYLEIVLGV